MATGILNVTLTGQRELIVRLSSLGPDVLRIMRQRVQALTLQLQQHVIRDKLTGQVLKVRSGALRRSIQEKVEAVGQAVYGYVYSAGDVKYAAIHEFGFEGKETIRRHVRTVCFGRTVDPFEVGPFERQMHMPERSFLRSSLADNRADIEAQLKAAAVQAVQAAITGRSV